MNTKKARSLRREVYGDQSNRNTPVNRAFRVAYRRRKKALRTQPASVPFIGPRRHREA